MKTALLFVAWILMGTVSAQAQMQIAGEGKAACVILTQPGVTVAERQAALELASNLREITGATFEIKALADNAPPSAIIIGPGPLAEKLFPEVNLATFGGEQLTMRVKQGHLLLAGGRPRGTLYAVCRFIQGQCGVRWWSPYATHIPKIPNLSFADLTVDETPAFESRYPYWYSAFDGDWAMRNGSNGQEARLDEDRGGNITYAIAQRFSHLREHHPLGFVHTTFWLVHPGDFIDAHPDWYAYAKEFGRHIREGQICNMSQGMRDKLVERGREWLKESPKASILSVSQMDQGYPCECPDCTAIDEREGSKAGSTMSMINHVAEKLGPEFPNVKFDTLAYYFTRKPPKTIRPADNVIVRLCSIECSFSAPMEDPSNKAFADDIIGWGKICKNLAVWDYTTAFENFVLPHPNYFVLGPNVRFFHKNNVKHLFEQGNYQSNGGERAEMRAWVLAQLLWNPYQDDSQLIDEFLDGYYGKPAGRMIREYMELMAKKAQGFHMGCFTMPRNQPPYLKFNVLSSAEQLWQKAEDAAKGDPDQLWRVKQGHLAVRYAFLACWTELRRECLASAGTWPLSNSRQAVAAEWLANATGPGPAGWEPMIRSNEREQTPQAFFDSVNSDISDPVSALSLGFGSAGLLGGDMTDPEDDLVGKGGYANDLPEDQLRPEKANWVDMKCSPANPPGTPAHQRHPYQSWQDSPACAVFLNKPDTMKWYVGFIDGGAGGPTDKEPYLVSVKFAKPFALTHFTITNSNDMPGRDPRGWAIQASNTGDDPDWLDIYRCNSDDRSGSPFRETPRCETVLFTSFTTADMAEVASPADVSKIEARLKGEKIGIAQFPRVSKAYPWYRFVAYSCFNPNSDSAEDATHPPGFALGQLELFGKPDPTARPSPASQPAAAP